MTLAAAGRAILDALEARIPAPLHIGPTSRLETQPGPLPVVMHTGGNGTLRTCTRCDVATTEPACFCCGTTLT